MPKEECEYAEARCRRQNEKVYVLVSLQLLLVYMFYIGIFNLGEDNYRQT